MAVLACRSLASACHMLDKKHINAKQATGETLIGRFSLNDWTKL